MDFEKGGVDGVLHRAVLDVLGLHEWYPRYPLVHGAPSRCRPGEETVHEKPREVEADAGAAETGRPSGDAPPAEPSRPAVRGPDRRPTAADRPPQVRPDAGAPARSPEPAVQTGAAADADARTLRRCRFGDVFILMHGAIPFAEADADAPLLGDILRAADLGRALQAERTPIRRVELEAADMAGELAGFVEACLGDDAGDGLRVLMFSPVAAPEGLADHPNVLWAGALPDIARDPDAKRALWRALSARAQAG